MAFSLFNPSTWGWGSDYPTGQSASLKKPQVLGASSSIPDFSNAGAATYAATTPGKTYATNFQGPLGPNDTRASSNFIGPTYGSVPSGGAPQQQVPQQQPPQQPPQGPNESDMINNAYSGYLSSLDQQLNDLGGFQNQQNEYINQQTGLQEQRLGTQKEQSLGQLSGYQTEAAQNKAKTLRDIQQDLLNSFQAGQVYLGGMGAGSSSAVGRMSGALAKGANRRVTDVSNQFGKIMNDINMQRSNIENVYNDQVNQLQQWKNEQINNIASWVQQQRQGIMNTKGQVDAQKNMQILSMAQQALADIDNQQAQFNSAIQQWVGDKSTSLQQYVQQMQGMGQYNVPGYTYDPMSGQFVANARGDVARRYYGGSVGDEEKQY